MTEEEIYVSLNEIFRELFDDDTITLSPETTAGDVDGWDSFSHLNIIVATEMKFGIRFDTAEVEGMENIGEMVSLIEKKSS